MSDLSDNDLRNMIRDLQDSIHTTSNGTKTLESELESAAKHIPAYIKIVKGHIEQLRNVLELENHNHRTLENAGLAAPVQQLIKLFNTLRDTDIQLLEDLAHAARNWHPEMSEEALTAPNNSSQLYEETAS
ncbi:MAG TPA: hypothetical protein VLG38_03330 [Gammaproteobacteria bacterium]|nr:hypothetical protein [Gammaproteobacteria bacterium]